MAMLMTGVLTMSTAGCGVPKSEHEKIVRELEKANQEKTTLSDQLNQLKVENESLNQKFTQSEKEITILQKEKEGLQARLAPKKSPVLSKPKKSR